MPGYDKQLWRDIGAILFRNWDPIGVSNDPSCPEDEYESYVGVVYSLLTSDASENEIACHLSKIEIEELGVTRQGRNERCHRAAQELLSIRP